jgi:hypothetical protein
MNRKLIVFTKISFVKKYYFIPYKGLNFELV